ncbi:lytic transglycosylase domain-containing protein [Candidatus Pelagibacter sp.]|nr:lytic transglycosylase domain-containing protein [Candidatus Pelagibacter sp.]
MIKYKKISILITIFYFIILTSNVLSESLIIPKKKPEISTEKKVISELKSEILPLKKPSLDIETEDIAQKNNKKKNNLGIILPKNKPLMIAKKKVEKKDKKIKSKYYNKKDFEIAKKAISFMEKRKWETAIKLSKKAKDKSIYNFIIWRYLLERSNSADYNLYKEFLENNKKYPRIGRVEYLSEKKLSTKNISPKKIIKIFEEKEPLSGFGEMILGESLIKEGNIGRGINLIKKGWIRADLNKNELRTYKKKFNKYLKSEDHIKRADYLAWENKYWDLKRMLRYLPKDYQALYNARQLLMSKSYGVDAAISKVPEKFKNDSGLNYDRLKWRRKRGRVDSSLEILLNIKNNKNYLVRPDKWWIERSIIARSLIYKKKYQTSYEIVNNHALDEGTPEFAEAEWLSGWISLSFLDDPLRAREHFKSFFENVGYPISLSRGAYWIARSYEALNDTVTANKYYKIASAYPTTYYGQLSHLKIFENEKYVLSNSSKVDENYKKDFFKKDLYRLVHLLHELDKDKYTKHILRYLALDNIDKGSEILSAQLATDILRYDFAIQISKIASYEKRFHNKYNYPVINTPSYVAGRKIPDQALILAVIRQESEFDSKANSYAGAKGMMQLMTYTAKVVAKQAKLPYSKSKLTEDPEYNIKLGSHYLAGLILEYDGSYPFAIAAYNAGPKRVRYWKKLNKDPQKKQIDYVDWIELIKFKETRNYVQRVLENYNVYRYILKQEPVNIKNFFLNDPLY